MYQTNKTQMEIKAKSRYDSVTRKHETDKNTQMKKLQDASAKEELIM